MLLSVFTPSHNPAWLADCHNSLRAQTHPEWEFVVVPNGDALRGDAGPLPGQLTSDPRVRVVPTPDYADTGKVGGLKRFATSQCRGDAFVELDHDDVLAADCLERVAGAVEAGAGFVYSDFVQLTSDGGSPTFDARYGWETYPVQFAGRACTAIRAFPPSAASLMHVWWAPNHVRAWTRAAYERAGGHDANLAVCDDVDLVARTYLAGVEFAHIAEPLYVYRMRRGQAQNTYLARNAEIQRVDQELSNRHFYRLVNEWCRRGGLAQVAIAQPGAALEAADDSLGTIRVHDLLHRVPGEYLPAIVNEYYRALAPGGWLFIRVPSCDSPLGRSDPTARSYWNRASHLYYTHRDFAGHLPGLTARFQATRVWDGFPDEWHRQHNLAHTYLELCALKGQRQPGLVQI